MIKIAIVVCLATLTAAQGDQPYYDTGDVSTNNINGVTRFYQSMDAQNYLNNMNNLNKLVNYYQGMDAKNYQNNMNNLNGLTSFYQNTDAQNYQNNMKNMNSQTSFYQNQDSKNYQNNMPAVLQSYRKRSAEADADSYYNNG